MTSHGEGLDADDFQLTPRPNRATPKAESRKPHSYKSSQSGARNDITLRDRGKSLGRP